jgi:hypothetical protein
LAERDIDRYEPVLALRWILIIAASYLVLFQRTSAPSPTVVGFVGIYLGSNVVAAMLVRRAGNHRWFEIGVMAFDAVAVSLALLLTGKTSSDFFLLYFVVMLIGALGDRLVLVVASAALVSSLHLGVTAATTGLETFFADGRLLRVPFLFVVALFFGHLIQRARAAEEVASEASRPRPANPSARAAST